MSLCKCDICGASCDGKLIIRDANVIEPITACADCLNDYGAGNFESLRKKVEMRVKEEKVKVDEKGSSRRSGAKGKATHSTG